MAVNTVITFVLLGAIATTTQVLNQLYRLIEASSRLHLRLPALRVSRAHGDGDDPAGWPFPDRRHGRLPGHEEEDREAVIVAASGAPLSFPIPQAGDPSGRHRRGHRASRQHVRRATLEPRGAQTPSPLADHDIAEYVASQGIPHGNRAGALRARRQRASDGQIRGLFILDKRDPAQEIIYIAEGGRVPRTRRTSFLDMFGGAIHVRATATARSTASSSGALHVVGP